MREIDPVNIIETIREGLLVVEPDLPVDLLLQHVHGFATGYSRPQTLS
jgi:hypothetical protein